MDKKQRLLFNKLKIFAADNFDREAQIQNCICSQNVDFLEMGLRDLALDHASLVLNIEIIHPILTKIETNLDRNFKPAVLVNFLVSAQDRLHRLHSKTCKRRACVDQEPDIDARLVRLSGPLADQRNHKTRVSIQDMAIDRKSWRSENAGTQIRNFIGSPNLKSSRVRTNNKAESLPIRVHVRQYRSPLHRIHCSACPPLGTCEE